MADNFSWGAAVTGSWDLASNWADTTTSQNPALVAPGAADNVTIGAAAGGATHVITGTGNSASLTISGPTVLAGQFATGTLTLNSSASLGLNAGGTLTVAGNAAISAVIGSMASAVAVNGGVLSIGGNLAASNYPSFSVTNGGTISIAGNVGVANFSTQSFQISNGSLTVGGTLGDGDSVTAASGAHVQLAGLAGSINLTADASSAIEIGAAGNAALGAITIDAGLSTTISGVFTAPSIVDNGVIVVAAGKSLTLNGGVFSSVYNPQTNVFTPVYVSGGLTGGGQVQIGAGAHLTIDGVNPNSANAIDFAGAGGVLTLPNSALNASGVFLPEILGFNSSDAIDFQGVVTSASDSGGVLTLFNGANAVAKLNLGGAYTGETFLAVALPTSTGPGAVATTQINVLGGGDTSTPPTGTSSADNYAWGIGIAGSWDLASNWADTTTSQNPALVAPGAADNVTIGAAAGGATHVITGTGNSASLTISGPTVLAGQFATGTLTLNSSASLGLNAGGTLTVAGNAAISAVIGSMASAVAVNGGVLSIGGNLAASNYPSFSVTNGGTISIAGNVGVANFSTQSFQISNGSLTVGGTLGDGDSVTAASGAHVQLAGLAGSINLTADASSAIEIGAAGNAALGAITIDAGLSTTISGVFTAPSIVDNGVIVVAAGKSLTLNGGVFSSVYNPQTNVFTPVYVSGGLTGGGQVQIGAGAHLTIDGVNPNSANAIDFAGAGGVLTLPNSALNASGVFLPEILGFNSSDAIDFQGVVTSASDSGGVLTLFNGANAVAKLNLGGAYTGETFLAVALPTSTGPGAVATTQVTLYQPTSDVPPSIQVPGLQFVHANTSTNIQGIVIADSSVGANLNVALGDGSGLLSASTSALGGGGIISGVGTHLLTIAGDLAQINADLSTLSYQSGPGLGADSLFVTANDGLGGVTDATVEIAVACFRRGTKILTARGEIAVENLAIGDHAITASGEPKPIVWMGHRELDCSRRHDPSEVWPICVSAGAFSENKPSRDLWLSPGHNVVAEGVLMPIKALLNGRSIFQQKQSTVEYWHIELEQHDIVLAEGMPTESYLDTGNRSAFVNAGAVVEARPDFVPKHWTDTCLPLLSKGTQVSTAKAGLIARLEAAGHRLDQDAKAHVVVDGRRVEPIRLNATRLVFVLPSGGCEIALRSKVFVPAHTIADSDDFRELGLCVSRLQVDGAALALDDEWACGLGWHKAEFADRRFAHRWTAGATPLPTGARIVIVDLAGRGNYWRDFADEATSQSA